MINYTERLRLLMQDIVARVEPLSFIDPANFSVFARYGRTGADGAYATCHCLCMPPSDPGYYFWRNSNGEVTRRSEWFVSKTPEVYVGARRQDYLISFALPRFSDQRLEHTRKRVHYPASTESWIAKLDTVVHELYHIDPDKTGIRQMVRNDGKNSYRCHSPEFFTHVADLVQMYLDSRPDPSRYDFLRYDFDTLEQRYGRIIGTAFKSFPSYPQMYLEPLANQPIAANERIVPMKFPVRKHLYTDADLDVREFGASGSRRLLAAPREPATNNEQEAA
jgi:hypothetical protein